MLDVRHEGAFFTGRSDYYLYTAGEMRQHSVHFATLASGQALGGQKEGTASKLELSRL